MIKVTYKKALKDNFELSACSNGHNFTQNSVLINSNMSTPYNKSSLLNKKSAEAVVSKNITNNKNIVDMSRNVKTPNKVNKGFMSPVLHSTPKLDLDLTERKKKEYINGLNLVVKLHDIKYKTSNSKQTSGNSFNLSTPSVILNTSNVKTQGNLNSKIVQKKASESDKSLPHSLRFLKDVTVVKIKGSINPKNFKEEKPLETVKLKSKSKKEENQLNNNVKKEVDGLKRKIKINEVVVGNKKVKTSPSKSSIPSSPKPVKSVKSKEPVKKVLFSEKIKNIDKNVVQVENNSSGSCKKEILMVDPDLPTGWKRMIRTRFKGTPNEKHIVYIFSPQGKKFQFKWKLRRYLERINSSLSADQFHFGLYKRTRPFVISQLPEGSAKHDSLNKSDITLSVESQSPSHINKNSPMSKSKSKETKNSSGNISSIKDRKKVPSPDFELYRTSEKVFDADGKQLLLHDPDLPFGWKRIINTNNSDGKLQVYIISPEGIIFRRRHRLQEYLTRNEYTHSLDRFYFGLHPKKDPLDTDIKCDAEDCDNDGNDESPTDKDEGWELYLSKSDMWKFIQYNTPMYSDPHLPEGWKRFIKIRQCGESAGRMEVILVSPDGKRHRSKLQLEQYILQNNLNLNADKFDFSVFGKGRKQQPVIPMESSKDSSNSMKRKSKPPVSSDRPVPDLEISRLKDIKVTPEGEMINEVAGIMVASDLSSARGERRLRMPRKEHEKILKMHLELERNNENKPDNCDILTSWIQRLVKCRSDFRALEPDAASLIAEKTEEFIKEISSKAFLNSKDSERSLQYEDVAHVVDANECLSALKLLIPKKITYKEYIKLNRPTQFMSFT